MSYEFDTHGWEDWAGQVHWGEPTDEDLPNVAGMFSRFYDEDTGDSHWHWVYLDPPPRGTSYDWDDWYDAIEGSMSDHGYELA